MSGAELIQQSSTAPQFTNDADVKALFWGVKAIGDTFVIAHSKWGEGIAAKISDSETTVLFDDQAVEQKKLNFAHASISINPDSELTLAGFSHPQTTQALPEGITKGAVVIVTRKDKSQYYAVVGDLEKNHAGEMLWCLPFGRCGKIGVQRSSVATQVRVMTEEEKASFTKNGQLDMRALAAANDQILRVATNQAWGVKEATLKQKEKLEADGKEEPVMVISAEPDEEEIAILDKKDETSGTPVTPTHESAQEVVVEVQIGGVPASSEKTSTSKVLTKPPQPSSVPGSLRGNGRVVTVDKDGGFWQTPGVPVTPNTTIMDPSIKGFFARHGTVGLPDEFIRALSDTIEARKWHGTKREDFLSFVQSNMGRLSSNEFTGVQRFQNFVALMERQFTSK